MNFKLWEKFLFLPCGVDGDCENGTVALRLLLE